MFDFWLFMSHLHVIVYLYLFKMYIVWITSVFYYDKGIELNMVLKVKYWQTKSGNIVVYNLFLNGRMFYKYVLYTLYSLIYIACFYIYIYILHVYMYLYTSHSYVYQCYCVSLFLYIILLWTTIMYNWTHSNGCIYFICTICI